MPTYCGRGNGGWAAAGVTVLRLPLGGGEAVSLQDVVGERIQECDGTDFFDAPDVQLSQVPVAPASMDAFADRADLVLHLAGFAPHSGPPSRNPRTVTATRQIRISTALGLGGRTEDLNAFTMCPLDVLGAAKPAIDEMAPRKEALRPQSFQRRPHEAAIRAVIADLDGDHDLLA